VTPALPSLLWEGCFSAGALTGTPRFPFSAFSWQVLAGHLLCTAGNVALQGSVSVWAAEGLEEGRLGNGDWEGLESSAGKGQTQPVREVSHRSSPERVLRLNSS